MRRTLNNAIKSVIACALLLATLVAAPVSAYAASPERTATVASVESTMMAQFPEGTAWDNSVCYVSTMSIDGQKVVYTGYGCVGFALQFVETAFGKGGNYSRTYNCPVSQIGSGDIVRVPSATGGHTYVVISTDETGATIAEANYNGAVHYNRHVSTAELAANNYVLQRL